MCAALFPPSLGRLTKILDPGPVVLLHRWAQFIRLVPQECSLHRMPVESERLLIVRQCQILGYLGRDGREPTLLPQAHAMERILCHFILLAIKPGLVEHLLATARAGATGVVAV